MEPEFTYYAFISYSRRDEAFAKKLQHYLEHYKLPSVLCRQFPQTPRHLHPIFRDKTDLPIDNLSGALRDALEASRHLIVLCTEHSARPNAEGKNWVDVEIDTFLQLRPENAQRVVAVVLPHPEDAPEEAYLPANVIRHRPPETDVAALGEERALNDIIAHMSGISPEVLWERHQQRLRAQRVRRRLGAAAAVLLLAAAGVWCWDYYVPHVRYYTDYVERDNVPEGLYELDASGAKARSCHYRFTTRMRLLRKVEHCNAEGKLVEHTEFWNHERPASMELSYSTTPDGSTTLNKRTHRNAAGSPTAALSFSYGNIDVTPEASAAKPKQGREALYPRQSVRRFAVERLQEGPHKGIIVQELHHGYRSAALVRDAWGTSGRAYELDALGRPVTVRFLAVQDATTTPVSTTAAESPHGVASYQLEYGSDGQLTRVSCFNKEGKPTENPAHWATATLRYGQKGEHLSTEFHDAQGHPLPTR